MAPSPPPEGVTDTIWEEGEALAALGLSACELTHPVCCVPSQAGYFPLTSPEGTILAPWHPVLSLYLLTEAPTRGQDKLRLVSQRT